MGHEIDFTISDFVADFRAATPSAAAELITEGPFASRQFVADAAHRLSQLVRHRLELDRDGLLQLAQRLVRVHPRRQLRERAQQVDDLQNALLRCVRQGWRDQRAKWQTLQQRLARLKPSAVLALRRQTLRDLERRLRDHSRQIVKRKQAFLEPLQARLRLLSPDNVLARGYSITTDEVTGKVLRAASETQPGQRLKTKLKSGEVRGVVDDQKLRLTCRLHRRLGHIRRVIPRLSRNSSILSLSLSISKASTAKRSSKILKAV
ncbi:MAG: hypothetical protein IPK15_09815 [Verrucomicrobia bacterium]|nr:hypothetical protein [Verrucomicrobiota bacterium]